MSFSIKDKICIILYIMWLLLSIPLSETLYQETMDGGQLMRFFAFVCIATPPFLPYIWQWVFTQSMPFIVSIPISIVVYIIASILTNGYIPHVPATTALALLIFSVINRFSFVRLYVNQKIIKIFISILSFPMSLILYAVPLTLLQDKLFNAALFGGHAVALWIAILIAIWYPNISTSSIIRAIIYAITSSVIMFILYIVTVLIMYSFVALYKIPYTTGIGAIIIGVVHVTGVALPPILAFLKCRSAREREAIAREHVKRGTGTDAA